MSFSIGTLFGALELEDQFSAGLDLAKGNLKAFGTEVNGIVGVTAIGFGALTTAIGAAAAGIVYLGNRGSSVDDITQSFKGLTAEAGDFDDVLGALRGSVDGTISDFDLMRATNEAFSRGLRLTKGELALTGETARILADRVGIDTTEAFEKLTKAMSTGAVKSLKQIGFETIDVKRATEEYAASIGKEASALTEAQKIEAVRIETLRIMREELERTGGVEADFTDRVDQTKVAVSNFTDQVGVAIATSPVILHLMGEIADAITNAFGDNSQEAVQRISKLVNQLAIFLVDVGSASISMAKFALDAFYGVRAGLMTIFEWLFKGFDLAVSGLERMASAGAALHLPGIDRLQESLVGARDVIQAMSADFGKSADDALNTAASWEVWFNNGQKGLATLRGELVQLAAQGASPEEIAKGLARITHESGLSAAEVKKIATEAAKLADFINDVNIKFGINNKLSGDWLKQIHENSERVGEAIMDNFQRGNTARLEAARINREITMTETQFQIDEVQRWGENEKNALDQSVAGWEWAADQINAVVKTKTDQIIADELLAQQIIFANLDTEAAKAQKQAARKAVEFGKNLAGDILGAFQNGGDWTKIGGTIGSSLGGSLGNKAAEWAAENLTGKFAQLAAGFLGPLGSMLGGLLGKGIGAGISKLFKSEGRKVNDLRDAFVSSQGGIDELNRKAQAAGMTLDQLLSAKKVDDFNAAVDRLNMGFEDQAAMIDNARAAAESLGIPMERMGQAFKQGEVNAAAEDLLTKIRNLGAAGVDMATIVEFAGDDLGALIHQAIRMGTTVPREFEKIAAAAIEAGTLVDENGEAFTDLGQIPFAQDLNAQFSSLMTTMSRFFNDFFDNLNRIPSEINFRVRGEAEIPEVGGHPVIPMAEGGITTGPTLALIGERGREVVAPLSEAPKLFGSQTAEELTGLKERMDTLIANFRTYNAQQPTLISMALRDALAGAA